MRRRSFLLVAFCALTACSSGAARSAAHRSNTTTSTTAPLTTTTVPPTTTTTAAPAPTAATPGLPAGAHAVNGPVTVAQAAADLTATATVINNPAATDADLDAAAAKQQAANWSIVVHPDWMPSVKTAVPADLRALVEANATAGQELRALTRPATKLPPWRIVAPAPAAELLADYKAAEAATGVPWAYLAAINFTETKMGRIRGTSTAGAQGPMQFLPSTWARYGNGGDINNPRDAIFAAGRLLQADGAPGNMNGALYAYNHSDHYVRAVTLYAQQMQANERTFFAYHGWRVFYRYAPVGDLVLEVGYAA